MKSADNNLGVEEFKDTLNSELKKIMENAYKSSETFSEDDVKLIIEHHVNEAKRDFVNSALKSLDESKGDYHNLWHNLYGLYESVLEAIFTKLQVVSGDAATQQDDNTTDTPRLSDEQIRALLATQKRQMIDLLGYKEVFTELLDEFDKIKGFNNKIMEAIEEQAVNSEELQIVLMDFEKVNKFIDKCLKALGKNIESISSKIETSEHEQESSQMASQILRTQTREQIKSDDDSAGDSFSGTSLMDTGSKENLFEEQMQI
ncbi:hypothetical protein [Candidatus Magnetomonas plexicatena]|uniref:hypothetical protein n=1 Tax=Candidatus Magnetomonas plexicatena TaxID=2552947 RepID=UPI0040329275